MIRFIVFSDLHYDEIDDGDKRLDELVNVIKREKPDFCMSLGDFCTPEKKKKEMYEKIKSAGVQVYYVIGNHEVENNHLDDVLHFLSMERDFYSFEYEDCKFIILNSCYFNKEGEDYSYFEKIYKEEGMTYPVISQEQIEWLQRELKDEKRHIVFSHHSLVNDFKDRGIYNREVIRKMFEKTNVILCMNGHDHGDELSIVNDIPYYTVNSASYMWAGGHIASSETLMCAGMTFAIEPMVNAGVYDVWMLDDDWTVVTKDSKKSAHYENTILITEGEPEILSYREDLA